jgi:hypothetical protein
MLFAWNCDVSKTGQNGIRKSGATVTKNKPRIPEDMQRWIDARKRFHLSHAQVQMARELGMNPPQAGLTGQPQARTLESSASGLHRTVLSQALWQSSARPCYFRRGPSAGDCREESRKARAPARRQNSQCATTRSIEMKIAGRSPKRWGSILNPQSSILNPQSSILDPAILNPTAQTFRPFPSLQESADRSAAPLLLA